VKHILLIVYCFLCCLYPSFSQKCIWGIVVNEENEAVSFASIATGTKKIVVCDSAGFFKACFSDNEPCTLIVKGLGYESITVKTGSTDTALTITLKKTAYMLREVMVMHAPVLKEKSMASTITVNKNEILRLNPQNVSEVLQSKSGFTNRSGYQTPLTLRGMSGKQLLVLRNGVRRFSSYPSGYMSHTINVYDLERIEVEKGAASVVYGAGAMAGIVNLIDKSPFKQDGLNAKITTGYSTVNNEKNALGCGGWSNGKFAVKAGLRYRSADNFNYPDGTIAENSYYTDKDAFVTLGYKLTEKQTLVINADFHNGGPWGKPVGFNGSQYMRVQTKDELSNNYNLQYSYTPGSIIQDITFNVFYSDESREFIKNYYAAAGYMLSYRETTTFSDYYYGSRLMGRIKISPKYYINMGGEMYRFYISTPTDAVDYINGLSFQNRVSKNAQSSIAGAYVENNFIFSESIKLVAGIRYDFASVYEGEVHDITKLDGEVSKKHALGGNIAASYKMGENTKLKVNIARSFRMPEPTELYADSYTSNGILFANPDLEPEYCNSFDISYNQKISFLEIKLSPFLWLLNNMISRQEQKGLPGTHYQYTNIGKSRIWGGELTLNAPLNKPFFATDKLDFSIGFAFLNGTDVSETDYFDKGEPLNYVPPFNMKSNVSYSFPLFKRVDCNWSLRSIYYAEQSRLSSENYATPSYLFLGTSLGVSFPNLKTKPSINIVINNLLNKEYYSYYSYLPNEGRDFRLFLTFHFD
jgi:outer membrane receptor protein involved in Fe transport